jgi:hypothetical protein
MEAGDLEALPVVAFAMEGLEDDDGEINRGRDGSP